MRSNGVPNRLWDYGLVWASEINSRTARGHKAQTPLEEVTGISEKLIQSSGKIWKFKESFREG